MKNNEKVISAGVDNIIINNKTPYLFLTPSIGYVRGLPFRFEAGLNLYWPFAYEGVIRQQVNPRDFELFDLSYNLHYGTYFDVSNEKFSIVASYTKIGFTLGKRVREFEPFINYYQVLVNEKLFSELDQSYSLIGIGLGIPHKKSMIIPEITFQVNVNSDKPIMWYSVGFRVPL